MGAKIFEKILMILVIVGFVLSFFFGIFYKYTGGFLEIPYLILNYVLPFLVLILFSIILFSSDRFRNIWNGDNTLKKVFSTMGNLILIAITAVVSWGGIVFFWSS